MLKYEGITQIFQIKIGNEKLFQFTYVAFDISHALVLAHIHAAFVFGLRLFLAVSIAVG